MEPLTKEQLQWLLFCLHYLGFYQLERPAFVEEYSTLCYFSALLFARFAEMTYLCTQKDNSEGLRKFLTFLYKL